jgi:hypothetical protein
MKRRYALVLLALWLPAQLWAEAIGSKNGLLQQATHQQVNQRVHEHLKPQIKIENVQPYTANESHSHPAIRGCVNAVTHKHAGSRRHEHTYNCPEYRRFGPVPRPVAAPAAGPQASATNVQEQGVDEADLVKTDGRYLFAIVNMNGAGGVRIYDTQHQGDQLKQIAAVGFGNELRLKGMYLLAERQQLVVIGEQYKNQVRTDAATWSSNTSVILVDVSNKAKPRTVRHVRMEGSVQSTRRIQNQLYLVLSSHTMQFPSTYKYLETPRKLTAAELEREKQQIVTEIEQWDISDHVPHYREPGKPGAHPLIRSGEFYFNPDDVQNYSLTTLLSIDLQAPQFQFNSIGWLGYSGTVYASQKAMYITSYFYAEDDRLDAQRFPKNMSKQLIHKFAFKNKGMDYRGSGVVLGDFGWNTLSSFQLDEDNKGHLRVVTHNWNQDKDGKDPAVRSPVVLTALAEHPQHKQLVTLSRLPNKKSPKALGKPGEQLYGARLFDDYAYFVTFERTDPLYVVDLRNPRDLKVTGELIIPGFSDYLHPLGDGLLVGVGKEAGEEDGRVLQQGLKLSLFDVRNPRQPAEVDKLVIGEGGTDSPANRDHHAFTSLAMRGTAITRIALPVALVESDTAGNPKNGLHRFEVDRNKRQIRHLGVMQAVGNNRDWWMSWDSGDRSIIIDDRVYFYHDGQFRAGRWE